MWGQLPAGAPSKQGSASGAEASDSVFRSASLGLGTEESNRDIISTLERGPSGDGLGEETPGGGKGRQASQMPGEKPKKYIKQYEMGVTLGKGSYAKVKMCINTDNGKTFAVKVFNKSLLKRRKIWDGSQGGFKTAFDDVMREIAIMKKLDHENVMNMYDVIDDTSVNKLYMVMDFCRQGAIMESTDIPCAPLNRNRCMQWFTDSVMGLDYLHYQGVVHFDLKPDNILVAEDGRAVISDFGVSRVLNPGAEEGAQASEDEKKAGMTRGSPGTPSYTAPEVWGARAYHGKTADVWSLGVTLHAMAFGTLPYFALDQQELIAMVTTPEPWSPGAHAGEDPQLIDLIGAMLKKKPDERTTLTAVKQHPWLAKEVGTRKRVSVDEYAKIEVNVDELKEAIISGHVANFRRNIERGTLSKLTPASEGARYKVLLDADDGVGKYLPKLIDMKQSTGRRVILEMEDLTHDVGGACLMDIKMGTRTFTEEDVASMSLRDDLLSKMKKMNPEAVTPADEAAGGITKLRYLQFREEATTTKELGFRIDAVQLAAEAPQAGAVPDAEALRSTINTVEKVRETIELYVQKRPEIISTVLPKLRQLRKDLETCATFQAHEFVRTSVLLVYSNATNACTVHIIDLTRVSELPPGKKINHLDEWKPGNHEDGYLVGLDNLIRTFEEVLANLSSA